MSRPKQAATMKPRKIFLTDRQIAALTAICQFNGESVSAWIRRACNRQLDVENPNVRTCEWSDEYCPNDTRSK